MKASFPECRNVTPCKAKVGLQINRFEGFFSKLGSQEKIFNMDTQDVQDKRNFVCA